MATRKPLVRIGGKNQQLPAADTIDVPGARFHEGDTEPTIKSYGDRWLHGSMAIEYTWVDPGVWVDLSEPTAADVAAAVHAATGKTTPVDADELGLSDSESSWSLKKLTWANLKAALLAYFKGQFREKLSADRTYYVRTDGSDSNNGLSDSSAGAFLTIQKAIDVAVSLDVSLYQVTINVRSGTYGPIELKPYVGSVAPLISGDTTTPANVVVNATASGVNSVLAVDAGNWRVQGLKVQASGVGGSGYRIEGRTTLTFAGYSEFGTCAGRHIFAFRAAVLISANTRIVGGASSFLEAGYPGSFISYTGGSTCTLVGAPVFSYAFVAATLQSLAVVNGITFSGSATGPRYAAVTNGIIQTFGSGETYLPGNAAGSKSTGGQYL